MTHNVFTYISVFLAAFVLDWSWVNAVRGVANKQPLRAALFGCGLFFLSSFITIEYIQNYMNLLSALIGSFIGTFLFTKYSK